jgi:UDP-N-acetylmuramoyl-tripeptide--D-alanyl-D-alanine ligase
MLENFKIFELLSHIVFVQVAGFYLITNLQWFNYIFKRVIFHHTKYIWHIIYLIVPIFAYYLTGSYFWIYFYFAYLPSIYLWHRRLDKKLVVTDRVKRFFLFLFLATLFQDLLCVSVTECGVFGTIMPLAASVIVSSLFEKMLFASYKKEAQKKLAGMDGLKIIAITASYGKTSIKNYLYALLKDDFNLYKTPRSVNTIAGLVKDVNSDMPDDIDIYIAEAGARVSGDIKTIAEFLGHRYAIVGKIGPAHIEYFKTLENIRNTKMELRASPNLEKIYIHQSAQVKPDDKGELYGHNIRVTESSLKRLAFEVEISGEWIEFESQLLGSFNAENLGVAILMAHYLGVSIQNLQQRVGAIEAVEHRLQRIDAGGKVILDDSFNGNLEGMLDSYDIVSGYEGRKVIITPGIVESTEEANIELAKKIDEVFDIAIITGKLNAVTLATHIKRAKKIILNDKSKLEETLGKETRVGDLILFSNDAPSFI